jgi:HAD superfamily hydrolase (TIGR01509 family)
MATGEATGAKESVTADSIVIRLCHELEEMQACVALSTRGSVTASLLSLNLLDRFDTLVCAGDYRKSKPDPEAFLLAAAKLGVPPQNCLVFEDTEMGIRAATAAGMASVKIPPPWERISRS